MGLARGWSRWRLQWSHAKGVSRSGVERALRVPSSSFYDWRAGRGPSARDVVDAYALQAIIQVHQWSRGTYGVRRVHAELALGGTSTRCRAAGWPG